MHNIKKGSSRKRYILFFVSYKKPCSLLTDKELIHRIQQQTHDLFSKNTKELGLWLIHFNGTFGIIKCNSQEKKRAKELLESLTIICSKPVSITTLLTSGTIRGLTYRP